MNRVISFFFTLIIISCNDSEVINDPMDDPMPNVESLGQAEIEPRLDENCIEIFSEVDCEVIHVGQKPLPEELKVYLPEYSNPINTLLLFEDENNNELAVEITNKTFKESITTRYTSIIPPNCKGYCLDNEIAKVFLQSDVFSLELALTTHFQGLIDEIDPNNNIGTGFLVYGKTKNSISIIFNLPIANFEDQLIEHTPDQITFHENIELNGNNYANLFSNENRTFGDEKIYLDLDNGLIAVRDSLGVLWTRK